jgi:hypothetical protein
MLDRYAYYADGNGSINSSINGYESATDMSEMGNGAFNQVFYCDPTGAPLPLSGVVSPAYAGATYDSVNGVPTCSALTLAGVAQPIYVGFRSTEKLVLSPFVFSDCHEWDTGLFGINNIQLIMNLQAPSRIIRNTSKFGCSVSAIQYNATSSSGAFANSRVNCQFLTPSLDVPLPPKSVVPYMEFPRYITAYQGAPIAPGSVAQIQSQTITLPQIPDLFIIYVKPNPTTLTPRDGDYYFPVATSADGITAPLTINFDNFSGLLSSQTSEQLYSMSVHNGLDMDWNTWSGAAHMGSALQQGSLGGSSQNFGGGACGRVPLVGGLLVLKPSQDITLQTGQAPSLNYGGCIAVC